MVDLRFSGTEAWMVAVTRALLRPGAGRALEAMALDPQILLTVARVEASHVAQNGVSSLSHEQIGLLTELPRVTVCRARVILIEWGLESLATVPSAAGGLLRRLHDQPDS